eukprot:345917_1
MFFVLLIIGVVFGETSFPAEDYVVNMDEPADVRWAPMCSKYGAIALECYNNVIKMLPEFFVNDGEAIMLHWFNKNAQEPYKSEIKYFANCTGIPLGGVVVTNLLYDMTAFCTSIVAEDENGNIFHGRNLDYGALPLMRNMTFNAHFTNNAANGQILYSTTMVFAYAGTWTGMRPDKFSISQDERDQGDIVANIKGIHDDFYPPSWLIRDLVSNKNGNILSYNDALNALINTKLMAPVYFIIGGTKYPEGAVVTRNQTYSFNLWPLETSYLGWYDVETNYDWWVPPPKRDDRRDPAIKNMNDMGQNNLTAMGLYNVLSQPPVLNDGTLYTSIMSASNASLYTMIRFP